MKTFELQTIACRNRISIILIFAVMFFPILFSTPAMSGSSIRRGATFTSKSVEITNIESKLLEEKSSGCVRYLMKARVRNRTNRTINVTIRFQAFDRDGSEIDDVIFYDKSIRANGTANLTSRNYMNADDYKALWTWKIEKLEVE